MNWRILLPIVAFVMMIPLFSGLDRNKNEIVSPLLDQQAPTFSLPSLRDPAQTVGSATYAGDIRAGQRMGNLVCGLSP